VLAAQLQCAAVMTINSVVTDLRFAVRLAGRNPAAALLAILSLALGIGANTAVFSLVDTLIFKPLPIAAPDRVFQVAHGGRNAAGGDHVSGGATLSGSANYQLYQALRDAGRAEGLVAGAALSDMRLTKVTVGNTIEPVVGQRVTGDYHATLGVRALIGRAIEPNDSNDRDRQPVAVLGYEYWRQRFGADARVLGRTILVEGEPHTIVGVTSPEFFGLQVGRRVDVTTPLDAQAEMKRQGWFSMPLIVRLAPGVGESRARAALEARFARFVADSGMNERQRQSAFESLALTPAGNGLGELREEYSRALLLLAGVVGLVLLLACANVSAVQLARAQSRTRELTIRRVLGAGRGRLMRQLMTESALLAIVGGAAGLFVAWWGANLLASYLPGRGLPSALAIEPDRRVLAFTVAVSTLAAILVGMMPAIFATRRETRDTLASGARVIAGRPRGAGRLLAAGQIALACVLLAGAVLFLRSLWNLRGVDTGVDGRGVIVATIDASEVPGNDDALGPVYRGMMSRIAGMAGVEASALTTISPLSGNVNGKLIDVVGQSAPAVIAAPPAASREKAAMPVAVEPLVAQVNTIAPAYFETFQIPLLRGRRLTADDRQGARRVVVVSESFARRAFGIDSGSGSATAAASPLGHFLGIGGERKDPSLRWEIVGVVKDVLDRDLRTAAVPTVYVSYEQVTENERNIGLALRARGTVGEWTTRLRQELGQALPGAVLMDVKPLSRYADEGIARDRMLALLCGYFGIVALFLTAIGIYGLMSQSVAQRTAEIGVRMAFGAERRQVQWLVLRESLPLVAAGLAAGAVATMMTTRVAEALVFGVRPGSAMMLTAPLVLMAAVAIAAIVIPAWRASRVDPLAALRAE
jgi:predicted permease